MLILNSKFTTNLTQHTTHNSQHTTHNLHVVSLEPQFGIIIAFHTYFSRNTGIGLRATGIYKDLWKLTNKQTWWNFVQMPLLWKKSCHRSQENILGPRHAGNLYILWKIGRGHVSTLDKSSVTRCNRDDYCNVPEIRSADVWPEYHRFCLDDLASSADGAAG